VKFDIILWWYKREAARAEPDPDDGISTDSISITNCIDNCFPGCKDACLVKGFKDGFCLQNELLLECCCQ